MQKCFSWAPEVKSWLIYSRFSFWRRVWIYCVSAGEPWCLPTCLRTTSGRTTSLLYLRYGPYALFKSWHACALCNFNSYCLFILVVILTFFSSFVTKLFRLHRIQWICLHCTHDYSGEPEGFRKCYRTVIWIPWERYFSWKSCRYQTEGSGQIQVFYSP